jgi:glutamyl endopeptidase
LRFTNSSATRRYLSALIGGLFAVLMTLVFVAPAQATVIGTDDRYQVGTTTFPYNAVVEIQLPGTLGRCSGWLYGPDMVATAGHCVYDKTAVANGWFSTTGMTVWPGRSGTSTPYGGCGVVASYAPSGWTTDQNEAFDYAALRLNCTVGNSTGLLHYGVQPTVGYQTRLCGYPSDKPVDTQWCSDDQVRAADAYQVYYANDTATRMSGSPVLVYTTSGWNVTAIHTMPVHGTAPNHSSYNHGTRITSTVSNDLYNWEYYG